jgi:hypothetical protein
MLAGTEFAIWWPDWANCSIYDGWCHQPETRFRQEFCPSVVRDCSYNSCFTDSAPAGHRP